MALVALVKEDGTRYHVSRHRSHGLHCDCGDFEFRRNWSDARGCKHARALTRWRFL